MNSFTNIVNCNILIFDLCFKDIRIYFIHKICYSFEIFVNCIDSDVIFRRTLFKISRFLLNSVNATEVRHQQYRQQTNMKITTVMTMTSPHACDDIWRRAQQALSILLGRWRYERDQKCLQVAYRFDVSLAMLVEKREQELNHEKSIQKYTALKKSSFIFSCLRLNILYTCNTIGLRLNVFSSVNLFERTA